MVKLTLEALMKVMDNKKNIRNISVIAHVDHGKSTLTDSLVHEAGLMKKDHVGKKRFTDTLKQEIERGVTIKSTSITLIHKIGKSEHMINIIDSPGHIDFSSEVTAALRVTDGAVVVIDAVEGFRSQTLTVIKQALQERIVPVLMINKIDRLITQLGKSEEELYERFVEIVDQTNAILEANVSHEYMKGYKLNPSIGNVCFGAGKDGMAFTIPSFLDMLCAVNPQFKKEKLMKYMWGEYYFDESRNKFVTNSVSTKTGKKLQRTFVHFILKPIYTIYKQFNDEETFEKFKWKKVDKLMEMYKVSLANDLRKGKLSAMRNNVLQLIFPAAPALLQMIITHLPSPLVAQEYRTEIVYSGDVNDKFGRAMKKCDPNGPLMLYISKNVEVGNNQMCFGRIFAGTLKVGQKVWIFEEEHGNDHGKKSRSVKVKKIQGSVQRCFVMLAKSIFDSSLMSCGCVTGIIGFEKHVMKTATVSTSKEAKAFIEMKFSVSPVVQVGISTKDPRQLKALLKGLRRLVRSDPLLRSELNEQTGQQIIAGAGEFHIETSIETLKEYCPNVEIIVSEKVVSFKETIISESEMCLAKSKNKLNRVFVKAQPLSMDLLKEIEQGSFNPKKTQEYITKLKEYGFDKKEVKKIWCFGPEGVNTNVLVNGTKGINYINEVTDHIKNGFLSTSIKGVLCGEELRGVRFDVVDGKFHSDNSHRGADQISSCMRRAMKAVQISGKPRLVEPWYKIDIQTTKEMSGNCYNILKKKKAIINFNYDTKEGFNNSVTISALIPVLNSFGIVEELRSATSGRAFASCLFSHWDIMKGDPYDVNSGVHKLVMKIRKRKKMKLELPSLEEYRDKL